jgi:hypothetical protein
MNMAASRQWTVALDVDSEGKVAAQVTANDKLLLPSLNGESPDEALQYVSGALVDVLPGDTVDCSVQCPIAATQRYKVASAGIALMWLSETVVNAARLSKLAQGGGFSSAPKSGTRIKAVQADNAAGPKRQTS